MTIRRSRLNVAASAMVALPLGAVTSLGLLAALPPTPAQADAPGADLKVLSPHAGDALGTTAFSLDVAFHSRSGSPVTTAELWVDGQRWVRRDLDAPQTRNVLSFAVDASSLSEGMHNVVVKVFCADGASSQTQVQIEAGDNAGVSEGKLGGPDIKFSTPDNGRRVQGSVELVLDAPAKNGSNPYITIYIDKQFKTLKNYPPYSYTWDTTAVSNGIHTVEATGYLESSDISTTRRIKVFVDNAGGNTTIQKDVVDLSMRTPHPTAAATVVTRPASALTKRVVAINMPVAVKRSSVAIEPLIARHAPAVASVTKHTPVAIAPILLQPVGEPITSAAGVASVEAAATVRSLGLAQANLAHVQTRAASPDDLAFAAPLAIAPQKSESASHVSAGKHMSRRELRRVAIIAASENRSANYAAPALATVRVGVEAASVEEVSAASYVSIATPTLSIKPNAVHLIAPQMASAARSIHARIHSVTPLHALRNSTAVQVVSAETFANIAPAPRSHASLAGARAVVKPHAAGTMRVADGTQFQVAFDGQQIAFDVPPRVEAGLPIAPFRQIFEHTGGQVEWHPQGQVVRAINADREVIIKVGSSAAQVNGQTYTMQRAAFIDRGRTIVPLSFVGQALDVNVKYDPATGHLEISSK